MGIRELFRPGEPGVTGRATAGITELVVGPDDRGGSRDVKGAQRNDQQELPSALGPDPDPCPELDAPGVVPEQSQDQQRPRYG